MRGRSKPRSDPGGCCGEQEGVGMGCSESISRPRSCVMAGSTSWLYIMPRVGRSVCFSMSLMVYTCRPSCPIIRYSDAGYAKRVNAPQSVKKLDRILKMVCTIPCLPPGTLAYRVSPWHPHVFPLWMPGPSSPRPGLPPSLSSCYCCAPHPPSPACSPLSNLCLPPPHPLLISSIPDTPIRGLP